MSNYDADLLRDAMRLTGLSARELAERAELHRVSVSNFARGLPPSAESWVKIEKALRQALTEHAREVEKVRRRFTA